MILIYRRQFLDWKKSIARPDTQLIFAYIVKDMHPTDTHNSVRLCYKLIDISDLTWLFSSFTSTYMEIHIYMLSIDR